MNVSELYDTIVEAELRTLNEPPNLPVDSAKESFLNSKNRLLVFVSFLEFLILFVLFFAVTMNCYFSL